MLCTECVGADDEPQCRLVCPEPLEFIVQHPDFEETEEELMEKYEMIHG